MKAIAMKTCFINQHTTVKPAGRIEREFNMPVDNDCMSLVIGAGSRD